MRTIRTALAAATAAGPLDAPHHAGCYAPDYVSHDNYLIPEHRACRSLRSREKREGRVCSSPLRPPGAVAAQALAIIDKEGSRLSIFVQALPLGPITRPQEAKNVKLKYTEMTERVLIAYRPNFLQFIYTYTNYCYQYHTGSHLRATGCHLSYEITHSFTCHPTQENTPRFNHRQTGWYSIYLPRRDVRLS